MQQVKPNNARLKRNRLAEQMFAINEKFRDVNPTHEEWIEIIRAHDNLKAIDIGKVIESLTGYRKYLKEIQNNK